MTTCAGSTPMADGRTSGVPRVAERGVPTVPYPLTADLAGVLAVVRQERTEDLWRVFTLLFSAVRRSDRRAADAPLDSAAAVR